MPTPAYNPALSPIKNVQAILRSLSIARIEQGLEQAVAQLLQYLLSTALALTGTLTVGGLTTLSGALVSGIQALAGAGAVNLTTLTTALTTTGANALTLANGADGQIKIIRMVGDGGDGTLTPTTKTGFATITFNDVGDSCILQYHTTLGWMILANNGCTVA